MRAAALFILGVASFTACASFGVAATPSPPEEPDAGAVADGQVSKPPPDAAPICSPPALHCDDFEGSDFSSTWTHRPARFATQVASGDARHGNVAAVSLPRGIERGTVREALFRDLGALATGTYRLSFDLRVDEISDADAQDVEVAAFQVGSRNFHINVRVEAGERRLGFGFFTVGDGPGSGNAEVERSLAIFEIGAWQTVTVEVVLAQGFTIKTASARVDDGPVAGTPSLGWNAADKTFFVGLGATYVADVPDETKYSIDDVRVVRLE